MSPATQSHNKLEEVRERLGHEVDAVAAARAEAQAAETEAFRPHRPWMKFRRFMLAALLIAAIGGIGLKIFLNYRAMVRPDLYGPKDAEEQVVFDEWNDPPPPPSKP